MLQFPAFMTQFPVSTRTIPTSYLLSSQWPQPQSEELLLAMEESDFEDKFHLTYDDPRKLLFDAMKLKRGDSNLAVIGKTTVDNDKEEYDNDADDDDADNVEESEGEEFEQETN
ncbi:hypothetical protein OIU74_024063 [Salix koriyanagi]|uniref:Uncharacterized protein n=1 Tax=Salix koriyanagi TaxID=2511006 RepID=A0A9Q0WF54_9ROSI|nr:hypothetical protein OIU74_024063 [Salix koriyanagi]